MEFVNVYEPRSNVVANSERTNVVYSGGSRYNEQLYIADSWGTVGQPFSQCIFSLTPPSTQTIVDRYIKIKCYFEVTVDADLEYGLNTALRAYPIHSLCEVLTVTINGESISDNVSDKLHAMLCFGNTREDRNNSNSTTPIMPDQYQEYKDWAQYGSAKNPLASYGENSSEDPRGGFIIIPDPDQPLRKFKVVCSEPLMMSPFFLGVGRVEEGFVNINQLNINYRWTQNLSKILSHSNLTSVLNVTSVTMYKAPELLVTYITPSSDQLLPALQTLPYHKTLDFIKSQNNIAPGETRQYISDAIKLSQIPESLYFFVRRNRGTSNQNTTDSYCRIDNVNIQWNNQSGLLSTASSEQLFEISKRNGLNMSYQQYSKYRGSIIKVKFGENIGLEQAEAIGVQGQYLITLTITYTNVSTEPLVSPEAMLIFMQTGTIQIAENMARASLGILTRDIVLATKGNGRELAHADYMNLQGGSFMSGLKSFFNKISHFISPVAHALSNVPMVGKYAGPIATISDIVKNATGGGLSGGLMRGRGLSGGRRLSRRKCN